MRGGTTAAGALLVPPKSQLGPLLQLHVIYVCCAMLLAMAMVVQLPTWGSSLLLLLLLSSIGPAAKHSGQVWSSLEALQAGAWHLGLDVSLLIGSPNRRLRLHYENMAAAFCCPA